MSEKVTGKVAEVFAVVVADVHLRSSVALFQVVFLFAPLQGQPLFNFITKPLYILCSVLLCIFIILGKLSLKISLAMCKVQASAYDTYDHTCTPLHTPKTLEMC